MGTQRDPTFLQALAHRLLAPRQLHILIVDADTQGSQILADALGRGHSVTIVGSVAAAREAIDRRMPTLVVTELDLPDASGMTLISMLHSRPATSNVLLMVLSHRSSVQDKIAALQAGADDYVVKPIDPRQFANHVRQLSHFVQVLPSATS